VVESEKRKEPKIRKEISFLRSGRFRASRGVARRARPEVRQAGAPCAPALPHRGGDGSAGGRTVRARPASLAPPVSPLARVPSARGPPRSGDGGGGFAFSVAFFFLLYFFPSCGRNCGAFRSRWPNASSRASSTCARVGAPLGLPRGSAFGASARFSPRAQGRR